MKVDHLVADVHGHGVGGFTRLKSKPAIERDHRLNVLHWQRNMIEPADASGPLRLHARSGSRRSRSDDRLHEGTTRGVP
jgi:hypothetical protein